MTRRFRWSLVAHGSDPAVHGRRVSAGTADSTRESTPGLLNWIELALATPVVLWGGWPFFARGWASIVSRHLNMFTLIALGVGAAYGFSVVATLAPDLFPHSFRMGGAVAVYFEPAAAIVVLVLLGQVLELRARSRTSAAIRNLLGLAPKTARRIDADGTERDVPLADVYVSAIGCACGPGERVPVDGVVRRGRDERRRVDGDRRTHSRGESAGRSGDRRHRQWHGTFVMEAQRVGADTLLAQIVRMVSEAQRSRAPIQRLADTVSAWFVPTVVVVARS